MSRRDDRFDDDLMALADASGVTHVDEPIPFVPADFPILTHHQAVCADVRRMAAVRAHTRGGAVDMARWELELLTAEEISGAQAEINRRWFGIDETGGGRSA